MEGITMTFKGRPTTTMTEEPFELVLLVRVKGYGKDTHALALYDKVCKELRLQFGHVTSTYVGTVRNNN
jgi:hypothetical protein